MDRARPRAFFYMATQKKTAKPHPPAPQNPVSGNSLAPLALFMSNPVLMNNV